MRLAVNKTYKMLIGGQYVRSESNRTLVHEGEINYPRSTRKDVKDAVKVARGALSSWASKTAYNRGQILYRMAEMLEARTDEFAGMLGKNKGEVQASIDRLLYYAGWSDKYQQILGTVNPVAAPYFNFSVPEPVGVVAIACAEYGGGLLSMVTLLAPAIIGGNTVVMLAPDNAGVLACEFGEVVGTSDVPGGVVNILTGRQSETVAHLAKHMDVNTLVMAGKQTGLQVLIDDSTENLKRLRIYDEIDWSQAQGLSWIEDFQEIKTVWHPVGV